MSLVTMLLGVRVFLPIRDRLMCILVITTACKLTSVNLLLESYAMLEGRGLEEWGWWSQARIDVDVLHFLS